MTTLRPMYYALDPDNKPVPTASQSCEPQRVALDTIGDKTVSTVFLDIDHGFSGPPVLWETLTGDGYIERYTSHEDAVAGHARIVDALRRAQRIAPGQRYRHRKGGLYEVVVVACDHRDKQRYVIYRNVEDGNCWARPIMSFVAVLPEGPRFAEVVDDPR